MPDDPQNPDSLGDERTLDDERDTTPKSEQSLGDAGTHADGGDSSLSDLNDPGDVLDFDLPLVDLAARYEIEGELGKGGMGAVQLATDRNLQRKVAIKRIHASSPSALRRFVTEARSIAALNHFNIVQVHEFERDEEGPFLVLEYVSGGSLLDRLKEGKLEVEDAIGITCQLCDALAVAHEQGIIHRDIKPANILLTTRGEPKLTDFGLARQDTVDHGQTQEGAVLGTIDFMPPEQRRDATAVDIRSDLWSLAATCYQMLTGKSPKIIRLDQLPANLAPVIGTMLEEDPEERFQTAGEFKAELRKSMATAVPDVAADLAAGICPACNTANDASRKFCRGCGDSLRVQCLGCEEDNPVWENICGECGTKQDEQRDLVKKKLVSLIEESVALAHAHEYEKALAQLKEVRKDKQAFTEEIRKQAAKQIKLVKVQQDEKYQLETKEKLATVIEESQALARAHEYEKAQLKVQLENVPAERQHAFTEEMFEELAQQLKLVTAQQKEQHLLRDERLKLADQYLQALDFASVVKELEEIPVPLRTEKVPAGAYSRAATSSVVFYQLADDVTEELEHLDLPPKQKRVMELVAGHPKPFPAQQLADEANCTQAPIKTLEKKGLLVGHSRWCHPISVQLSIAIAARDELPSLFQQIRDAIKHNRIDGLLKTTTRFLYLNPGDLRVQKLHARLLQRQEQVNASQAFNKRNQKEPANTPSQSSKKPRFRWVWIFPIGYIVIRALVGFARMFS